MSNKNELVDAASLANPSEHDSPLVALMTKPIEDMSETELSEMTAKFRAMRTTSQSMRKEAKAPSARKKAQPKINFNPNDLFS